jgi:hypothetical protein
MANYLSDREFTDYVHRHLAIPKIYNKIGWQIMEVEKEQALQQDLSHGIDYTLKNKEGKIITVQERFRERKYRHYHDATLRFRRANHRDPAQVESEFYKIKADYLVYGITDGDKINITSNTGFLKGVILEISFLQKKYAAGELEIAPTGTVRCRQNKFKMICPENLNPDGSSSFLPFDIRLMKSLWGTDSILYQKGYY